MSATGEKEKHVEKVENVKSEVDGKLEENNNTLDVSNDNITVSTKIIIRIVFSSVY